MYAAVYCRVSSAQQADGVSLEMQRRRCEDYVRGRDWRLGDVYEDVETGRHTDRPQLARLRSRLRRYDVLVCWRLDRSTRSLNDFCMLLRECDEAKCAFVSVTEAFDTSQPFGKAVASILAVISELESNNIGSRVRATRERMLERGELPCAPVYGYRRSRRNGVAKVVIDEKQADVVRYMFRLRASGRTHDEIATAISRVERDGHKWTGPRIGNILRDPAYIGAPYVGRRVSVGGRERCVPRSEWTQLPGLTPAIISNEEWHMAHNTGLKGRAPNSPSLFRGLLHCVVCGRGFSTRRRRTQAGKIVDYMCIGRHCEAACDAPQMQEAIAIRLFRRRLRRVTAEGMQLWMAPPEEAETHARLEEAEAVVERAQEAYLHGLVPLGRLQEATEELRIAQRLATEPERLLASAEYSREAVGICEEALSLGEAGRIAEANERLRTVLERITLDSKEHRLRLVLRYREDGLAHPD